MCIDDFAIKKRETYGTIMVDINTHRVIDMINSRDLENVTTWLKTYPNLQIVSRDGSVTYHNAITCAHSNALQISDRFHLFKNLTDYCKDYLKKELKLQVAIPATKSFIESPMEKIESKENQNRKLTLLEKYQKIPLLIESGLKKSQICTELNMDIRVYTKLMELTESEATTYFKTIKEERSLSKTLDKVKSISQEQYNNLLDTYSKFASIHTVIWNFRELVSKKDESAFYKWIQYARNLSIKEIDSFLNGIERDIDAVKNAIHYDYSNGLAEGSVNKLKVIKRIMYGRCGFETLRIKTLRLEKMRNIN